MRRSSFNKYIVELSEDELKEELLKLFDKIPEVKLFYKMDLGSDKDRKKIYDKAKKDIAKKYVTKSYRRPRRPRIQKVNKILSELKKSSILSFELIDIYLFTSETALAFNKEYQFYSDVLTNNICLCFEKAMLLIKENRMEEDYKERALAVINSAPFDMEMRRRLKASYNQVF